MLCEAPLANPRPTPTLADPAVTWLSVGDVAHKSLVVAGFTLTPTMSTPESDAGRWSLFVSLPGGPSILAIWSCPQSGGAPAYGAQVVAALDAYQEEISTGDVIVAGDFNIGQSMSSGTPKDWASPARARWEALGLCSVYHAFHAETLGGATKSTYFHRRHEDQGFHIDYILIHKDRIPAVEAVEVGTYQEWVATGVSDHVPIIIDLCW